MKRSFFIWKSDSVESKHSFDRHGRWTTNRNNGSSIAAFFGLFSSSAKIAEEKTRAHTVWAKMRKMCKFWEFTLLRGDHFIQKTFKNTLI